MRSFIRILASLVIALGVLFYLFHGSVAAMQSQRPAVQSVVQPVPTQPK